MWEFSLNATAAVPVVIYYNSSGYKPPPSLFQHVSWVFIPNRKLSRDSETRIYSVRFVHWCKFV